MSRTVYHTLFAALVLFLISGGVSAYEHLYYDTDGTGTYTYYATVRGQGLFYHNDQVGDVFYLHYHISTPNLAFSHLWARRYQGTAYTTYVNVQDSNPHIYTGNTTMTFADTDDAFMGFTEVIGFDPVVTYVYTVSDYPIVERTVSGTTGCVDDVAIYIKNNDESFTYLDSMVLDISGDLYGFDVVQNATYRLLFSDSIYYDFVCDGDVVFDYDMCIYVYGYTCGVDSVRLYKYDGGWVLNESVSHGGDYNIYEFMIEDGEDYLISFADHGFVCYNETFSCTGSDVHIDFDRCYWVYPPSAGPEAIYLWAGYDYNIVIMKDAHGNFIENSQVAIYDKTDDTHIYKWADTPDGYLLLGTKFDTDHEVQITTRTFDGIFTLNTVFPANGTPIIGEEDIAITNWTIPIMYNLGLQPVDQTGKPIFDVFCGLMEYTPLNPLSFWGMDLSDRGYVPVTNCSGFAMCDIIAEKDGYTDYNASMLNWTSRSAMVKDYRHSIVMEVE